MSWQGAHVAIVTPFRDGEVDFEALDALVERQIEGGITGLVPCGTTGESATLSHREHAQVIQRVVDRAAGRVLVMAGTGSNSTREAIELTRMAEEAGADGALVITPYYNKPTQHGLTRHFLEVAGASSLPIILYNVPGRTGVDMQPETVATIFRQADNVVAIKEASGRVERATEYRLLAPGIEVLSGDDHLTWPMVAAGACGVISVLANVLPGDISSLCSHAVAGRMEEARRLHDRIFPLARAMFLETNPIPVKTALRILGVSNGELRPPLYPMQPEPEAQLRELLEQAGVLA